MKVAVQQFIFVVVVFIGLSMKTVMAMQNMPLQTTLVQNNTPENGLGQIQPTPALLSSLEERIKQNEPSVETTIEGLSQYFIEHPGDYHHARFLNLKAYRDILKQDYVSAYQQLLDAREYAKVGNNELALAESFRLEGFILDFSGEHGRALDALNHSLELYSELNSEEVLSVYSAMGNVYASLEDFEKLLSFSHRYLSSAQRLANKENEGIAYYFQGYAHKELGNYQDAKVSLLLANEVLTETKYPFVGIVYSSMAELHIAQGNMSEALRNLNKAAEADRKVGFLYTEGPRLLQLVEIYLQRGEVELAISELEAGLKKEEVQNDKALLLRFLEQLISLFESKNDYQSALQYSKLFQETYKQSFNEQQSRLLALNRVRLAIAEKEDTIQLLEKDNQLKEQRNIIQQKTNTFQLYFIGGVILSLILVISLLLRTRQQRSALNKLAKELQKATDAKSDFLARMSHEVRTPLNAIIGLTKLSQRAAESKDQQTNLLQIEGASKTLLSVVNDILDFSKIEAGKMDIESTPFNIDALVNQAIRYHLPRANEKQIELIQHIARDVPHNLIGDPLRIQQILNNFLSNALKFTDDGLVSVSVGCELVADNVLLEFEVKDTGIGLNNEEKNRLFQPFNQGNESTSRRYGGTGLGLAICQQLASLMGGKTWVESKLGKGASFYFTVNVERNSAVKIVSPSKQLSALKVLVVDDVSLSRHAISEALLMANIEADLATGGQEAIAKLRNATANNAPYDLLILDWKMPDIDGLEVVAIMNQEFAAKPPKVIMLSAFESGQMREQATRLGIKTFIKKPFGASELINNIQELCLDYRASAEVIETDVSGFPYLAGKNILLAEDNALNQKVALGLLKDTHANIQVASNGIEAVDILRRNSAFDLVLMDIQMPEMDGLEATKVIRSELQLTMPIIAMTAHAMQQDIDKSIAAGMNAHLNKPVEPEKLFSVLATLIREHKATTVGIETKELNEIPANAEPLKALSRIDKTRAMQSLLNDESLYTTLLTDFLALQAERDALALAIADKDYPSISRIVHIYSTALKYIGAYELAELTRSVELTIQNQEEGAEDFETDFDKQLEIMSRALAEIHEAVKVNLNTNGTSTR
ncbi:tetratricopeptide repeat-containing hybrid sensor histidine kinase/response regulator [Alteromonas sp. P256]|uniref:tetratricopeptide repeat-containing hybrid sensor histidine kinase/response regulator n=1 Tax=Alteromonas sp. P256 TaxID=3117399 RepID=UPI002FE15292